MRRILLKGNEKQRVCLYIYQREKAKFLKVRGLYTCWSNIEYTILGLDHINPDNKIGAKPGSGRLCFRASHTHKIHQRDSHATSFLLHMKKSHTLLYTDTWSITLMNVMNEPNQNHTYPSLNPLTLPVATNLFNHL